jgi:hypothetical protein
MSDASLPHCERCGIVEYACECERNVCVDCGCELSDEEIATGRHTCFDCYSRQQD